MEIQVHTDRHVSGDEEFISFVASEVVNGLGPCARRVMGVHVHLAADRITRLSAPELRCLIEARPRAHASVVVTHRAATKDAAVRGAVADLRNVLERMFARMDSRHPGTETIRHPA